MANIQVLRIKSKLEELFEEKISMLDVSKPVKDGEYNNIFISRCLAAYAPIISSNIEPDDAALAITDGYHDEGIDLIFKDDQLKKLILVQAKFSKNGEDTISLGDTLKYIRGVEKIINLDFDGFNDKILQKQTEIESAIKDMDYKIELVIVYTSNSQLSAECNDCIDKFISKINEDGNDELIIKTIYRRQDVYEHMSANVYAGVVNLNEVLLNDWGIIEVDGKITAYYGAVSAAMVAQWWQEYGTKLLSKNIRFFKGDTEVNQGINRVLEEEPHNFFYYNNGIKITANKINRGLAYSTDRKTTLLNLEEANVVNGAQTVGVIGQAYKKFPENVSKARIMLQIISLEGSALEFGERITKLSNTQNRIDNKDFVSMDPNQERLRKDLLMDGIEYIYKSGSHKPLLDKWCSVDDATIALGCYADDVSISTLIKRAYGSVFENLDKAPYKSIFNPTTTAYRLWNTVAVYRQLDKIISEYQSSVARQEKLILIHGNRFILHIIFFVLKSRNIDFENGYIDVRSITDILKETFDVYAKSTFDAKMSIFPDAYPANVFKNNTRCRELKEKVCSK